mgnify:CR=1 FL=1
MSEFTAFEYAYAGMTQAVHIGQDASGTWCSWIVLSSGELYIITNGRLATQGLATLVGLTLC